MKLIIAGGRDYVFTPEDFHKLTNLHYETPVSEVICGTPYDTESYNMPHGADQCGAYWAYHNNVPIKDFPADWKTYGKAAGPIRNREMAKRATAVALFPGDKGTANMFQEARRAKLQIFDFRQPT